MADKDQDHRIFVGGLSWDVTERQLESAFGRFGKIIDCQFCRVNYVGGHLRKYMGHAESVLLLIMTATLSDESVMLERDSGRPRGFGFLTFADRRAMEDAIKDMHGREFGDRVISVNKAQPKMGGEEPGHGYGAYSGGRGSGGYGGDRSAGADTCFKCGRPGHWARDCPSMGGGRGGRSFSPPRSRYGAPDGRGDRYAGDRDRYVDDRIDRGRYGDRDRYDSRDDRYGNRDRIPSDRYPPVVDRFPVDRYGAAERFPQNGYSRDRAYDRDGGGPRGGNDRYSGGAGGPVRYDGRGYRERPAPFDRPRRGGRPPSMERY